MKSIEINDDSILRALSNNQVCLELLAEDMEVNVKQIKDYFIKQNSCILFIDGGSRGNPGESGIGIVLVQGDKHRGFYYYTGISTNNEAEYRSLIMGLEIALKENINNIKVYSDSELICNQINGIYKVKNKNLIKLFDKAILLVKKFNSFTINHIKRDKNKDADKLANIAMNKKSDGEVELAVVPPNDLGRGGKSGLHKT